MGVGGRLLKSEDDFHPASCRAQRAPSGAAAQLRELLSGDARHVAPLLLGAVLTHEGRDGLGLGADHRGGGLPRARMIRCTRTPAPTPSAARPPATRRCSARPATSTSTSRTACTTAPISCAGQTAWPPALLLRAGEVVAGQELAREPGGRRRNRTRTSRAALPGLPPRWDSRRRTAGGTPSRPPFRLELPDRVGRDAADISSGPRVGVSGDGGSHDYPWRFWLSGDPTVSRYKAAKPAKAPGARGA